MVVGVMLPMFVPATDHVRGTCHVRGSFPATLTCLVYILLSSCRTGMVSGMLPTGPGAIDSAGWSIQLN